jgi:general secretion pathway protein C
MLTFRVSRHFLARPNILATIASIALFIAVLAAWAWVFRTQGPLAAPHPAPATPIDVSAGDVLLGTPPDRGHNDAVQLLGILAFDPRHAAAIISVGDAPAHVVRINGSIAAATTLSEVRSHSIIVEHNGVQREITLPVPQNPSAFVR